MQATVVITTKNRRDELRQAILTALTQDAHIEILVIDDGSTDGTAEMVRAEFPIVRLEQSEMSLGYIAQRNRAALLAEGDIIISIDDDALFISPYTVTQTLTEFSHPRIGVVAIPYLEPHKSAVVHQQSPSIDEIFITSTFIGTAHALRKEVFLGLGGYKECLFHQGEEIDLSIRMLQAGYVVRLGSADPIHHMESPKREFSSMDFYGRRNDILFAWHNVPMPYFPLHLAATIFNGLRTALRVRRLSKMIQGTLTGMRDCLIRWRNRQPVSKDIYLLSRKLKTCCPRTLGEIESLFPLRPIDE